MIGISADEGPDAELTQDENMIGVKAEDSSDAPNILDADITIFEQRIAS